MHSSSAELASVDGPRHDFPNAGAGPGASVPFRFYDNRQKYLAFVNTCNEKAAIARRAAQELRHLRPTPPALRIFDAGMGDATVLARLLRSAHRQFPTLPFLVVAKEISLEDVRLGLEKMPDRFNEHPSMVLVITNLSYVDAPRLMTRDLKSAAALNWQEVRLKGTSSHEYVEQIEELLPTLAYGWQTAPSPKSGNPMYVRPSVLVIYREDYSFLLDGVVPRPGRTLDGYDLVVASQPWRARMSAEFKARRVLAPLSRSLVPGGRLLGIQSCGGDPALEIVQQCWPNENPFTVDRHELLAALRNELGRDAGNFALSAGEDGKALLRYEMHTLPSEISDRIGTSTLFAAWNAAIYVNQIEDERLDSVVQNGAYLEATQRVLQKHGGLWFNDETFVVTRRAPRSRPNGGLWSLRPTRRSAAWPTAIGDQSQGSAAMHNFQVGEQVRLADGRSGTVVAVLERGEFAAGLETWRWERQPTGLVVLLGDGQFVHMEAELLPAR